MELNMKELQERGTEMLRVLVGILEEEKIPYSVLFGTMLGTIRHQGPIPWDYDIDICIPEPELQRFLEVMDRRLPMEYWVDFDREGYPKRSLPRIGLAGYDTLVFHIDIFLVVGFPKERRAQQRYVNLCSRLISLRCAKVYSYTGRKRVQARLIRILTFMIPADSVARKLRKLGKKYPYENAPAIGTNTMRDLREDLLPIDFFDTCHMPYADFQIAVSRRYEEVLRSCYGDYLQFPPEAERNRALNRIYRVKPLS